MADSWSWNTVFETLIGTGVGACVGVGGIWWQTNQQNKFAAAMRLTSSLYEASEIFSSILSSREIEQRAPLWVLNNQSLRFKNIAMLCNKSDQKLVLLLSDICSELTEKSPNLRRSMIAQMMGTITGWRSGIEERSKYLEALQKLLATVKISPSN